MKNLRFLLLVTSLLKGESDGELEVIAPESLTARFGTNSLVAKVIEKSHNATLLKSLESFVGPSTTLTRCKLACLFKIASTIGLSALWLGLFNRSVSTRKMQNGRPAPLRSISAFDIDSLPLPPRSTIGRRVAPSSVLAPLPSTGDLSAPQSATVRRRMASGSLRRSLRVDVPIVPDFPGMPGAVQTTTARPRTPVVVQDQTLPPLEGNGTPGMTQRTPSCPFDNLPGTPTPLGIRFAVLDKVLPKGENRWNLFERLATHGFIYFLIISAIVDKLFPPQATAIKAYNNLFEHLASGKSVDLPDSPVIKDLIWMVWEYQGALSGEQKSLIIGFMSKGLERCTKKSLKRVAFNSGQFYTNPEELV